MVDIFTMIFLMIIVIVGSFTLGMVSLIIYISAKEAQDEMSFYYRDKE